MVCFYLKMILFVGCWFADAFVARIFSLNYGKSSEICLDLLTVRLMFVMLLPIFFFRIFSVSVQKHNVVIDNAMRYKPESSIANQNARQWLYKFTHKHRHRHTDMPTIIANSVLSQRISFVLFILHQKFLM